MSSLSPDDPRRRTMDRLEEIRRSTAAGAEYWTARDLHPVLGYPTWREFEAVIGRAADAFSSNRVDPSHHIVLTHKMMGRGKGAQKSAPDYFLSRAASYLIAMNGDPSKPEIAAAQAYFAAQARRMELEDAMNADTKRLELREKVKGSVRRVSSAAKDAGVLSKRQGIFHEQRYLGLYEAVECPG